MYLFQDINKASKGQNFNSAKEARDWYRAKAIEIAQSSGIDRNKVMYTAQPFKIFQSIASNKTRKIEGPNDETFTNHANIGKMYMYFYDAKYKDILPFFDIFPLVFPIEFYKDGFLGLNLHYLPLTIRAQLMDALYSTTNNQRYNNTTILQINYRILKSQANRFDGYTKCVKRYLYSHVQSAFHYVNPTDWDKALFLPLQKWHINPNSIRASKESPPV